MQGAQDDRSQIYINYVTKGPNVIANISRKFNCCFIYIICTIYTRDVPEIRGKVL